MESGATRETKYAKLVRKDFSNLLVLADRGKLLTHSTSNHSRNNDAYRKFKALLQRDEF